MYRFPKSKTLRTMLLLGRRTAYSLRCAWRARRPGTRYAGLYDPQRVYYINPRRVQLSIDHAGAYGLPSRDGWSRNPVHEDGLILGGDWDTNTIPFEEMDVWQAFHHRFVRGGSWDETDFFKSNLRTIQSGHPLWDCHTAEEFRARLKKVEALFAQIAESGFRRAGESGTMNLTWDAHVDDVRVHVGRDGDYIFSDGRHRLCIAKILGLDRIPVRVTRRHRLWADFRLEVLDYGRRGGGKVYAPITHPDLADIPSHHGETRLKLIQSALASREGRLLDIGAHWGYFCHGMEEWGYRCTAVESSPIDIAFMKRIKRAEGRSFEVFEGSACDFDYQTEFDVVLGLNVFHHFIKTESGHENLQRMLRAMRTRALVFEPHLASERQMANAYRNYPEDEFVSWVKENGSCRRCTKMGHAEDHRTLYLLER